MYNIYVKYCHNACIKYRFYLAGKNPNKLVDYLIKESPVSDKSAVKHVGYLERLEDFYQNIDLLVAPIFAGSGTKIKILFNLSPKTNVPVIPFLNTTFEVSSISINISLVKRSII